MSWHRANNITDMHAVQPICIASGRGISNCTLFSVAASRGHLEGAWRQYILIGCCSAQAWDCARYGGSVP